MMHFLRGTHGPKAHINPKDHIDPKGSHRPKRNTKMVTLTLEQQVEHNEKLIAHNEKLQERLYDLKHQFFKVEKEAFSARAAVVAYKEALTNALGNWASAEEEAPKGSYSSKRNTMAEVDEVIGQIMEDLMSDLKSCGYSGTLRALGDPKGPEGPAETGDRSTRSTDTLSDTSYEDH